MNESLTSNPHLREIIRIAKNNADVEVLWLYGSQARHTAHHDSDYDLAVAFKTYIEDPVERRLRPEILAATWCAALRLSLSIIDINLAPLPLAYTVIVDNTLLYSRNDYRRMSEERIIMSKWEIDYCYHKKHYA